MNRGSTNRGLATNNRFAAVRSHALFFLLGASLAIVLTFGGGGGGGRLATAQPQSLEDRVAALEAKLEALSVAANGDWALSGVNVYLRNGMGSTDTINGRGNLIIGYDEADPDDAKTGSHNLIVGPNHSYSSHGGLVAGLNNSVSGNNATVSGGINNIASGNNASVSGGAQNNASGINSSVSGGRSNEAWSVVSSILGGRDNLVGDPNRTDPDRGWYASVSGGWNNVASGVYASVGGGRVNAARGDYATVSGGEQNFASGRSSSVSGGLNNDASGGNSSVSGGSRNEAFSNTTSIMGGSNNLAGDLNRRDRSRGQGASVSGGSFNIANGASSSVSGGNNNTATGSNSSVSGGRYCKPNYVAYLWGVGVGDSSSRGCPVRNH